MTTYPTLSGPSHPPAAGGPPRQLVILLHGYGSDGTDMIGLAPFLSQFLPHAEFIAPNAPRRSAMGFGYQWYALGNLDPIRIAAGQAEIAPVLDRFIDDALAARHLSARRLGLIGFSQGTMVALGRALRRPDSAAAIVGFSGMIADRAIEFPEDAKRPAILLIHGDADPVVPFSRLAAAEATLRAAKFSVETMVRPGLAHGIDAEGAAAAAQFLAAHLGQV